MISNLPFDEWAGVSRSLYIFLTAALPGCAGNHFLSGIALTKSYVDGQPFVVTKVIGSPSDVAREGCGGR